MRTVCRAAVAAPRIDSLIGMDTRRSIIEVTAQLLQAAPAGDVSTRDICQAAGITAPTLYHHFGDKNGLYDAVAVFGFESYLTEKRAVSKSKDPVKNLVKAWDAHVGFGVNNPALYTLMYGSPRAAVGSPAAAEAREIIVRLLDAVARVGRLRVDIELAVSAVEAACVGATLQAIREGYDPTVSAQLRDTVLASVISDMPGAPAADNTVVQVANQLAALVDEQGRLEPLKPVEFAMFKEWLRMVTSGS